VECSAVDPVTAKVGLTFRWGGYDFTVDEVNSDGVVVSTEGSRTTTLPSAGHSAPAGRRAPGRPDEVGDAPWRAGPSSGADPDLHRALKEWRREQARADGVPAYVVFNDRTLDEPRAVRPHTVAELGNITALVPPRSIVTEIRSSPSSSTWSVRERFLGRDAGLD